MPIVWMMDLTLYIQGITNSPKGGKKATSHLTIVMTNRFTYHANIREQHKEERKDCNHII